MFDIEYHHTEASDRELIILRTGRTPRYYPRHIHTSHLTLGVVKSGTVTLGRRDRRQTLHTGEHFSVRPSEVHDLTVAPETELMVCCLDDRMYAQGFPELETARFSGSRDIIGRLTQLCDASRHQGLFLPDQPADTSIAKVVQSLLEKPERTFSVAGMAASAGYSQWHFLRRFHGLTGMTPHAFQIACRVRAARLFLRRHMMAAQAATEAGFVDQSHMHKAFKFHHGLTPRQFLRTSFILKQK